MSFVSRRFRFCLCRCVSVLEAHSQFISHFLQLRFGAGCGVLACCGQNLADGRLELVQQTIQFRWSWVRAGGFRRSEGEQAAARSCGARRQALPTPVPAPPSAAPAPARVAVSARSPGTRATPRSSRPDPWWEPDRRPPSCGYASPSPTRACPERSERVMASTSTSCTAASPVASCAGKRSATSRCRRRKSRASSPRARNCRSISGGAKPRLRAFRATRRFPALVLGPVDFWALRRLAASRAALKAELKGRSEIPSSLAMIYSMTSSILLSMFFLGYGLASPHSLD